MANNSSNLTTDSSPGETGSNLAWRFGIGVNCTILVVHLWITFRVVKFTIKNTKKRRRSRMNGGAIAISAAVATITPIFRYLTTTAFLILMAWPMTDYSCEVTIDVAKSTFVVSVLCLYPFYWLRQRAFYRHPSLGHTFGRGVAVLSYASITIIITLGVAMIPLTVFPWEYQANDTGCVFKDMKKQYAFRDYLYTCGMLFAQLLLLGLFIHPLRLHHETQKKSQGVLNKERSKSFDNVEGRFATINSQTVDSTQGNEEAPKHSSNVFRLQVRQAHTCKTTGRGAQSTKRLGSKSGRRKDRLVRLVKRTLILASLSVVTDLIAMITVARLLPEDTPQIVNRFIYDIDLFFNVLAIAGSFENWRFFFFCTKRANKDIEACTASTASGAKRSPRPTEPRSSGEELSRDFPTSTVNEGQDATQRKV